MSTRLLIIALAAAMAHACGGSGKPGEDASDGTELAPDCAEEVPVDPPDVPDETGEDPDPREDGIEPADAPQDGAEMDEEEDAPGPCGNGILEPALGEVCDDGNAETEPCGRGDDCLGDCSLLEVLCGNGILDPGEACDEGAADSMGDCTTSCTVNDRGLGAPCRCEGCGVADFTSGTIVGCDNVVVPEGSGGVLACLYTFESPELDIGIYAPEGYCSIVAIRCEGPACFVVTPAGDLDSFSCPEGAREVNGESTLHGATVTVKFCAKACSSDSQCRWNAWDGVTGTCGQMACIPSPENPSVRACFDAKNLDLLL